MFRSCEVVTRPLKLFAAFYIAAVLFGAPLWSDIQATLLLAAILTACTGTPLLLVYKNDQQIFDIVFNLNFAKNSELIAAGAVFGSVIGCYIGAFVIPLDWDRPWQKYSFPNCVGTLVALLHAVKFDSPPSSPALTITPSTSSSSITSHGAGQFGTYRLGDIPKIDAIFFAIFDNEAGSIMKYIKLSKHLKNEEMDKYRDVDFHQSFKSCSHILIPKPELLNRLVKINLSDIKIMGHPIQLEHESYARHRFGFNMCFVVGKKSTNDCMYEPLVQKLAEYLVELEQQERFISNPETQVRLPEIMENILDQLNDYGECVLPICNKSDEILTTVYLKLCPSYRGIEPPKVAPYMVPMLIRDVDVSANSPLVQKMDVLSQKIISKIDGIRCVKEIASLVSIDSDLVGRCIRNLYFYECVGIVPLFLYQNCYVATEKLHNFYKDESKIKECQDFVKVRFSSSEIEIPEPKFSDIFRLYMSLTCGLTMETWCNRFEPRKYWVDERRLVQYGMFNKFVRKLSIFPVTTISNDDEEEFTRIHTLCDGTNAVEDLAVLYSVPPDQLMTYLKNSGKFEFISK